MADLSLRWFVPGRLSEHAGGVTEVGGSHYLNRDYEAVGVFLRLGTVGSGEPLIVDLNDDGTSMFGSTEKPALPSDLQEHNFTAFAGGIIAREGSTITMDIDQVSSETPGEDLTVQLDLNEA